MSEVRWSEETDVVVVGGGLAGYCAAIEAADAGVQVRLYEKEAEPGGSSVLSGGFLAFAGTDVQIAAGLEDSNERLFDDLRKTGGYENDEALVRLYVDRQAENYAWLARNGITFNSVQLSSGHSVPRAHALDPREMMRTLIDRAAATTKVAASTGTPVERLVRTRAGGPVEGVMVRLDGKLRAVRARRGVVLAAGGFSRNEAMLRLFVPQQAKCVRYGGAGNTGDGVRMGWALGAGLRDVAHIKGTFGFHPDSATTPGRDWTKLPVYRGGIAVNRNAKRYVDESKSYKLLGDAVLAQPDAIAFQVFDQAIMDTAAPNVAPFDFGKAYQRGLLHKADSLAELAGKLGLDAATLAATVERYNGFVRSGRDEDFGRTGLSSGYGKLVEIRRAPFYAYPSTSGLIATYCGLTVDTSMRVTDVFGDVIPQLYAAGEVTGGFHGVAYMTGSSLGKCVIFGRIAGASAAQSA